VSHPSQPEIQVHLTVPGPPYSPSMVSPIERSLHEGGSFALGLNVDGRARTCDELEGKGARSPARRVERSAPSLAQGLPTR
jgi:hypothetical protein